MTGLWHVSALNMCVIACNILYRLLWRAITNKQYWDALHGWIDTNIALWRSFNTAGGSLTQYLMHKVTLRA